LIIGDFTIEILFLQLFHRLNGQIEQEKLHFGDFQVVVLEKLSD